MVKISIIIPCREINEQTIKCIRYCLDLDYGDFEILVLPDQTERKSKDSRLKIITTGKVKPALKRNFGMEKAEGDLYAFIDDDAYPRKDWLKNAVKYFEDPKIGIVGGPNLTPENVNFFEKVSGHVLSNFLVLGPPSIRYKIAKNQYAKELPSCNYISRKLDIKYDPNFLTAEDSKYCFDTWKKGYKVFYAGDVIVYHHRRDSFKKHLKQMFIYARDIAWLTKKEFSFDKLIFSLLSFGLLFFVTGLIILISNFSVNITGAVVSGNIGSRLNFFSNFFLMIVLAYLVIMFFGSFRDNIRMTFYVWWLGMGTHFAYGIGWLKGIFSSPEKTAEVSWISR